MIEPICGWSWYERHKNDYTQADIEALTITISSSNGSRLTIPNRKEAKGIVKDYVQSKKKEGKL